MKRWQVEITTYVEVEAETAEDAEGLAMEPERLHEAVNHAFIDEDQITQELE